MCDAPATSDKLDITNSGLFDTALDANCNGGIVNQVSGPSICVVRYRSIIVETNASLLVVHNGSGMSRVVAFVADDLISIAGTLDVSANGITSGPGGDYELSGGNTSPASNLGAGGAGFNTAGGPGGSSSVDGGAANGGPASDPTVSTILKGGQHNSGGGGGATTLISCRGTVSVPGLIDSGGGGGYGGILFPTATPGGGGGAGGYVVLQGISVDVTGELYANGGGGGGGLISGDTVRADGNDGVRSDTLAAKGGQQTGGAGQGGNGGVLGTPPTAGTHPTATGGTPGGGGGSIGFFQSYTPAGVTPTLTPAHSSPHFQPNGTIKTR